MTDPLQLQRVLEGLGNAGFVQLYLDQFFSPELGAAVNDAVVTLFAGEGNTRGRSPRPSLTRPDSHQSYREQSRREGRRSGGLPPIEPIVTSETPMKSDRRQPNGSSTHQGPLPGR